MPVMKRVVIETTDNGYVLTVGDSKYGYLKTFVEHTLSAVHARLDQALLDDSKPVQDLGR